MLNIKAGSRRQYGCCHVCGGQNVTDTVFYQLTRYIGDEDTPVSCYVVHHLEMGVSIRQRLFDSVDYLIVDSEEAMDDSDGNANTDLTQVVDAGELLPKGKF